MDALEALKSTSNMKQMLKDQVLRNGLSRTITYKQSTTIRDESLTSKRSKVESAFSTMNKIAKGKLSLGAKILQLGRVEKEFRRLFSVREGEELLKASRCCLSTTAGPISGCLFISTDKLAFCSDKPIVKFTSPTGELLRFRYKVVIPLTKINRANQCENVKKPSQKYLHMVTKDDFEFWFMGFLNYKGTFKCLQEAVTQKLN